MMTMWSINLTTDQQSSNSFNMTVWQLLFISVRKQDNKRQT